MGRLAWTRQTSFSARLDVATIKKDFCDISQDNPAVLFLCAISQSDAQMTAVPSPQALDAIKNTYKMVGMSSLSSRLGTIRGTFSVGKADITRNVPITDSTKYRIAPSPNDYCHRIDAAV